MKLRALGKTGLSVPELALGTWGLSGDAYGPVEPGEAERTVKRALEIGVTLFDTCDAYGGGKTEALLGRALAGEEAIVVTRGGADRRTEPATQCFDPAYIEGAVTRSLLRLGRERLDVYLLHNPGAETLRRGEATDAVKALVKEGKIAYWGASVGDVESGRAALEQGAEVIEIAYNLFHSVDLHHLSGDVMVAGAGVLARSPLGYGLLAGSWAADREFPPGDHRRDRWTRLELSRRVDQIAAVRHLVKGDVRSLRGAAVRFALANHVVSSVVLGPRSVAQLEELVRETGSGPNYLPEIDMAGLPRALSRVGIAT